MEFEGLNHVSQLCLHVSQLGLPGCGLGPAVDSGQPWAPGWGKQVFQLWWFEDLGLSQVGFGLCMWH